MKAPGVPSSRGALSLFLQVYTREPPTHTRAIACTRTSLSTGSRARGLLS